VGEQKISIDYSYDLLHSTLKYYVGDPLALAEDYYKKFCEYILNRKPAIIGHFDLITKFNYKNAPLFFGNQKYYDLAEKYLLKAIQSQCIFEVNTGAIARGYRTTPYPDQRLLSVLKKQGAKVVLSSDSHNASTIDCGLKEARLLLKDVGFDCVYALYDGKFIKDYL
jgi:histidinol-phosphatase (PHP family)